MAIVLMPVYSDPLRCSTLVFAAGQLHFPNYLYQLSVHLELRIMTFIDGKRNIGILLINPRGQYIL